MRSTTTSNGNYTVLGAVSEKSVATHHPLFASLSLFYYYHLSREKISAAFFSLALTLSSIPTIKYTTVEEVVVITLLPQTRLASNSASFLPEALCHQRKVVVPLIIGEKSLLEEETTHTHYFRIALDFSTSPYRLPRTTSPP